MNSVSKLLIVLAVSAALMWLTASVSTALSPFVFAAVIAYITAPLAEKLEKLRIKPAAAALLIVLLTLVLMVLFPLALLPLIATQVREFAELLPPLTQKLHAYLGNDINEWLRKQQFDLKNVGGSSIQKAANVVTDLLSNSLAVLSSFFTILLITPLATFYFLRDRKSIGGELTELLPPHIRERALLLTRDLDNVLGEFLHGQLIVMTVMAVFYSIILTLAGVPFALTIGIISGILTFIPYVGFILGMILATLAGLSSFESFLDILFIWLLMGIGTTVETVLITPRLVGERIGLHPLAVLLSLMVMGELFGLVGVLAALPIAAILLVCGRHLRRRYIGSSFYGPQ